MPTYDFQCSLCKKRENDITLSLAEFDNPETVHELYCYCTKKGTMMSQNFDDTNVGVSTMTATHVARNGKRELTPAASAAIKKDRRARATNHFKKEVIHTVNKKDRQYFGKKHSIKT